MVTQNDELATGVAIDTTGVIDEIFGNGVILTDGYSHLGIRIDGDNAATYSIDIGVKDESGNIVWFDDEVTLSGTTVSDSLAVLARYARIRVSSAATTGSTANVYVAQVTEE